MDPQVTLQQFGGGRAMVMIGGTVFAANDKTLGIKFKAKAKNGANVLNISLRGDDTYTMEFTKSRGLKQTVVKTFEGICCDQLREIFERETGLYLSLAAW